MLGIRPAECLYRSAGRFFLTTTMPDTQRTVAETFEIGRYYQIPHVRARWPNEGHDAHWLPVIGPVHTDKEIIGFPHKHWHVDYRFLPVRYRRISPDLPIHIPSSMGIDGYNVFAVPITTVAPVDPEGEYMSRRLDDLPPEMPVRTYYKVKKSKCKAAYPPYFDKKRVRWSDALEAAYGDMRLKPGRICPHKGADLSTFEPDEKGCVTCPLHGLQWHVESGVLVPREGGKIR